MSARIYKRPKAAEDAEQIADTIATDSIESATSFLIKLEMTLNQLAENPGIGSLFDTARPELKGLRVIRVTGFPRHLIFYFSVHEMIEVVRILHGARQLDPELFDS